MQLYGCTSTDEEDLVDDRIERELHIEAPIERVWTVLTVAIRETVIKQYEAVCEAVGLFPVEVDTATFRLCNLFSSLVPATEPVAAQREAHPQLDGLAGPGRAHKEHAERA